MLKKLLLGIILLLIIATGLLFSLRLVSDKSEVQTSERIVISASEKVAIPQIIKITSIGVHTNIESVGKDNAGRMANSSDSRNVAWYFPGYKPGELGSAVISGHYDSIIGNPGVFFRLKELKKGDEIHITDIS